MSLTSASGNPYKFQVGGHWLQGAALLRAAALCPNLRHLHASCISYSEQTDLRHPHLTSSSSLPHLASLDLSCPNPPWAPGLDSLLCHLLELQLQTSTPALKSLMLVGATLPDSRFLASLSRLTNLQKLDLTGCAKVNTTANSSPPLAPRTPESSWSSHAEHPHVSPPQVTDAVLTSCISVLPCLRHLRLAACGVSGSGLQGFARTSQSRRCLKYLDLSQAAYVLEEDLIILGQELKGLQVSGKSEEVGSGARC